LPRQNDGVRTRRATGNENIHRNVQVERPGQRSAVDEDVGRRRAGADGDHRFGSVDLPVDGLDGLDGVVGDRACDAENIGVPRRAFEAHTELLGVVTRREAGNDLDVATVATARVHMEEPWAAAPAVAH